MTAPSSRSRASEWQSKILVCVAGLLIFETLTGLAIYLLPFSVTTQLTVLAHAAVGLVFIIPYAWYQLRHWRVYRETALTHVKLTGYFSLVATVVAVVSGLVLTFQAVFGTRISYGWDTVHIVATFAILASVLPHVLTLVLYRLRGRQPEAVRLRAAQKRLAGQAGGTVVALIAVVALAVYAYEPVALVNELPEDYNYLFGPDRPFAPSLATTTTNNAFDARSMGGSASCGTSGCHEQITQEWAVSAHRWSALDPAFQAVQGTMGEQNGPESTRYCAGCHDPISLFAGTKNLFREELSNPIGRDEGVSCIVCHSIKETDVQGNAKFTLSQPERYLFELRDSRVGRYVRDFLIRAYPRHHVESLEHRLFKSPEFCAACHKQFIDEEINQVGWVQLQNQFDNWRKSRWNHPGEPEKTIECRECHMPLTASRDPASGDKADYNRSARDGKHRDHRFLGANQFIPTLLELPGGEEQVALTEKWLQGKIEIPEIADKWRTGPAVPLELVAPTQAAPGDEVSLVAVITSNKVGHDFPTGPLDIIQAWLEVLVTDQDSNVIFHSGRLDDRHFIEPGSFIFKAEAIDQFGNLIDRHNLWEMVGVRYRRTLFPGFSDRARFEFDVPSGEIKTLHVRARLLYRKFDQFLLNFLFGEATDMTSPITVLSEDRKTIEVTSAPSP